MSRIALPPARALPLLAGAALLSAVVVYADSNDEGEQSLVVTATAYNSVPEQTGDEPRVGAWGDRLKPGMKAIAISRDLEKAGLTRGTRVEIDGLKGEYVVLDKMHGRWHRRIDIYMGLDLEAARDWGVRRVRIRWDGG